ncbi:MAG: hypothetical protein HY438_02670 [DPANN group archaeon]|nr:hypothetical protein [DPANN group archaeon]
MDWRNSLKTLKTAVWSKGGAIGNQLRTAGANTKLRTRVSAQHLRAAFLEESYLLAIDKSLHSAMNRVDPEIRAEMESDKRILVGAESAAITTHNIQLQITYLESDIKKIQRLIKLEKQYNGLNAYAPKIVAEKMRLVEQLHVLFADTDKKIAKIDAQLEWLYKVTAKLQLTRQTAEAEHVHIYQYIRYARRTLGQYKSVLAGLNKLA